MLGRPDLLHMKGMFAAVMVWISVSPWPLIEILTYTVMLLRGEVFGGFLGYETGRLINGFMFLEKRPQRDPQPFPPLEDTEETSLAVTQEEGPHHGSLVCDF